MSQNHPDSSSPEISDPRALPQPAAEANANSGITIDLRALSNNRPAAPSAAANPRAVAVALNYDGSNTPTVVASGYGEVAKRILDIAFAAGVKVREDATLAQSLAEIETGSAIPLSCFEAVAEIINYLYRLDAAPPQLVP
ncbi:MAG: EscU/YscU/HrcU family type III secretion system export apparatus switch protein [Candidatus Pacebacteria bacterium]|nr:EscU/YscU/HrcU family type III secretion system export apparatus switch protein [Candidatus Paceibacterota bacterium]